MDIRDVARQDRMPAGVTTTCSGLHDMGILLPPRGTGPTIRRIKKAPTLHIRRMGPP
jgi:hypothetical protein